MYRWDGVFNVSDFSEQVDMVYTRTLSWVEEQEDKINLVVRREWTAMMISHRHTQFKCQDAANARSKHRTKIKTLLVGARDRDALTKKWSRQSEDETEHTNTKSDICIK